MIILGIISIASAAANLRGHRINTYGNAINAWQSSGSAALQAAYATAAPAVVVTFPVAPLVNRSTMTTANFSLAAQTSVTPLLDHLTNDYPTTYNNAFWFKGVSSGWPTAYDSSALNVIRVTTSSLSVTVPSWTCSDVASPPGCIVQTSTGRRLSTTAPSCTSYARVLSSVSNVGLLVVVANASAAALSLDTCSTTYATVTSIPITASQYQNDNTVCSGLSATVVSAVTGAPPTVTLRSSLDPYAVAEVQTQCSLSFGLPAKSLAAVGGFLVATGAIATAGVAFCIWSIRRSAGKVYGNASPVIPAFGMAPQAQPQQQPMMIEPAPGPGYGMQQAYSAKPQQAYYVAQQAPAVAGAYSYQPGGAAGAPGGVAYGRPTQLYYNAQ